MCQLIYTLGKINAKSLPKLAASPDLEVNRRTFKTFIEMAKKKKKSLCVEEIMNFL